MVDKEKRIRQMLGSLFKSHPWHGVAIGEEAPGRITAYIEVVPTDTMKYELDKDTGHLKIDRPQKFSNVCPTLYGLIPQTYCGERTAEFCMEKTGRKDIVGDKDPLDICVLTEKTITHGDLLLQSRPIGGFRMLDGNEADDKIVAVLQDDAVYGKIREIDECPARIINRLKHYFLTYKNVPGEKPYLCEITHIYGRDEAYEVIQRSRRDYRESFGDLESAIVNLLECDE